MTNLWNHVILRLNPLLQLLWWSHAALMARCLSGSSSLDGAVLERGSDIMSEVRYIQAFIHMHTVVFAADIIISPCTPGIDSEGHAANFVETEQIVQYNNARASFVQVGWNYCCPLLQGYLFLTSQNSLQSLNLCSFALLLHRLEAPCPFSGLKDPTWSTSPSHR